MTNRSVIAIALLALAGCKAGPQAEPRLAAAPAEDWPVYAGNALGQRYSALAAIDRKNVHALREAWRFEAGEGGLQTSPLVIDGILYAHSANQDVVALDGATGKKLWRFSSGEKSFQPIRGLSIWTDGARRRLFAAAAQFVYALDPATGQAIQSFGIGGRIDLREGLGRDPQTFGAWLTTPGVIYRDLLITGFRTGEGKPAAPGAIRAFDVRTGALRWSFATIPATGDPGADTWPVGGQRLAGGANAWAGMALDPRRGILYAPTGSAVFDFDGSDRSGDNLYANTLLALDAATGKLRWHFQAVHHDLWDRDFASPPTLLTVTRGGKRIDAVAQASKQGVLYVLDRATGTPLFPITERPVPQSDVPGERTSPTQPIPDAPAPFARQRLTEDMLTDRTPAAHAAALARFRQLRSEGPFTPLGLDRKTIVFPGFDGGAEWGGTAADPARGILYLNANDIPWIGGLAEPAAAGSAGAGIYADNCAACHGPSQQGAPPDFPAIDRLAQRITRAAAEELIRGGKGRMPGFPQIGERPMADLLDFLFDVTAKAPDKPVSALSRLDPVLRGEYAALMGSEKARHVFTGYEKFQDPGGYPAVKPPWGTLNAIDLNSGAYLWRVPLGFYPELAVQGRSDTGTENYGGPLLTRSGIVFIGATIYDRKFRAFDARDGRLLWDATLPYAGTSTPITYAAGGRQFIVIATSGARDAKAKQGSAYVAFALPE